MFINNAVMLVSSDHCVYYDFFCLFYKCIFLNTGSLLGSKWVWKRSPAAFRYISDNVQLIRLVKWITYVIQFKPWVSFVVFLFCQTEWVGAKLTKILYFEHFGDPMDFFPMTNSGCFLQ